MLVFLRRAAPNLTPRQRVAGATEGRLLVAPATRWREAARRRWAACTAVFQTAGGGSWGRSLAPLFCLLALLPLTACAVGSANTCQSFQVPNAAMEPTLHQGQIIPVDTAAYASAKPKRGATVVVKVPTDPSQEVVLRVIGLPGETVKLTDTQTFINGKLLTEPFVLHRGTQQPQEIMLGPDQYFLMGDNRPASLDSRMWGPIALKDMLAQWGTENCPAN